MIFIFILLYFSIQYSHSEEWTIHVYTGTERFAGTDSSIFIRLFNSEHGYTPEHELTHENWVIGDKTFPLKNLFESGEHDKFRINTEKLRYVEKLYVRRNNFPLVSSDWHLDRIVVERNRDSTKFTFKCNCWLRTEQPDITIPALSDSRSIDKNNTSKDNQTIVVFLIVSIAIITCFICFIYEYCRRRRFTSIETPQEPPIINRYYPQIVEPPSAPLQLLDDTINRWEDTQYTLPPYNDTTVVIIQSTMITSTDEPPAYKDLFPD